MEVATASLSEIFREALSTSLRPQLIHYCALEDLLRSLIERARAEWTTVIIPDRDFLSHLAGTISENEDVRQALEDVQAADLYLACACAMGDGAALAAFEAAFFGEIKAVSGRLQSLAVSVEDFKQLARQRLFVATEAARPKIAEYSARGTLRNWFRVMVTRMAINVGAKKNLELRVEDDVLAELPLSTRDPELEFIKHSYRAEFKQALGKAAASLTSRERNLLRHSYLDGLSIDRIAAIYGVHRATAARWLDRARSSLMVKTREELTAKLRLGPEELESILRLVRSRLDITLGSLLTSHD